MKTAILIHGTCDEEEYFSDLYPPLSNSHWFPWLQKQLLTKGIFTQTPEMLDAYKPEYEKWKKEFERFGINEESILVGHSCGGGFLLRWLTENKRKIDKLILIAPWLDPEKSKTTDFFEFQIDSELINRVKEIHLFVSEDDDEDIHESVDLILKALPNIEIHKFKDKGHFTFGQMKTDKFPELLETIIK